MNQLFNLSSFRPFHSVSKHPGKSTTTPLPLGIPSPGLSPVLFQGNTENGVAEPGSGDSFTGNTSTSVSPQSLFQAIASENLTALQHYRYLPSQQPDLRYQFDSQGKTLAHLALESDNPKLIAAFLETGFPLYTFDFNGKLPGDSWWDKNEGEKRLNAFSEGVNLALMQAIKSPQGAEDFEKNLKHQLDLLLNRVDRTQKNHLQKAMELLKPTITYVPDPDCDREDKAIATPCTPENRMNALARIQCLLTLGARPNVDGLHLESPVLSAAKLNEMELLKHFLAHGASGNVVRIFPESYSNKIGDNYISHEYWTPETPLQWAVKHNNSEMIEALLQSEAPMVVSEGGIVHPMSFALQGKDDPKMLDKFIQAGASIETILDKTEGKGITPLGMALINNQTKCVDYLLAHGASPNGPVGKDKTYLHLAVERKDYETVDKLLNAGADPNLSPPKYVYGNKIGGAPLVQAVRNGDLKMVNRLIEAGASPNLLEPGNSNSSRQLPLVEAIETHRSIEIIETLLACGANPNLLDPKGSTLDNGVADSGKKNALAHAILRKDPWMVQKLLDHGGNPDIRNDYNGCSLQIIGELLFKLPPDEREAQENCLRMIRMLLDSGADLSNAAYDSDSILNPFIQEYGKKDKSVVYKLGGWSLAQKEALKTLIAYGAKSPAKLDSWRATPESFLGMMGEITTENPSLKRVAPLSQLQAAVLAGNLKRVQALEKKGPVMGGLNQSPDTPVENTLIQLAIDSGNPEMLQYLISKKCPIPSAILNHWVEQTVNPESALPSLKVLVDAGLDVNAKGDLSRTPLHLAVKKGNLEKVKALLALGANPQPVDDLGKSPLSLAQAYGNPQIISALEIAVAGNASKPMELTLNG